VVSLTLVANNFLLKQKSKMSFEITYFIVEEGAEVINRNFKKLSENKI
jgi:hypothetical protein